MKNTLALIPILALLLVTGCSTTKPIVTPAIVQEGSAVAIGVGLQKYPEARPYVVASIDTICSMSAGTNLSPASILAALSKTNAVAYDIVRSAVLTYNIVWNSFVSEAVAQSAAPPYLKAVCDGGHEALASRASRGPIPPKADRWPALRP